MSGITDTLFGKEATPQTTLTGFQSLPTEAQNLLTSLIPTAQTAIDTGALSQAGLTDEQQALINRATQIGTTQASAPALGFQSAAQNLFGQSQDFFGGVNPLVQQGTSQITADEIIGLTEALESPFLSGVIDPAIQDIRDEASAQASNIANLASSAGAFGGTRQALLESELGANTQQEIGRVSGDLRQQARETALSQALSNLQFGRSQALAGAGQLTGAGSAAASSGGAAFDSAAQNQMLARQKQTTDLQNILSSLSAAGLTQDQLQADIEQPLREIALLQSIAGSFPTGGGTTGATAGTSGLLSSGGDETAGLVNLASMLLSDARLKENIKYVGNKGDFKIYEFDYKNKSHGEGRYRGVMAQDIEKIMPNAVIAMKDGYKAVDYSMIGLEMERV